MAKGFSVTPKTENPERVKSNMDVFELSAEDKKEMDKLDREYFRPLPSVPL